MGIWKGYNEGGTLYKVSGVSSLARAAGGKASYCWWQTGADKTYAVLRIGDMTVAPPNYNCGSFKNGWAISGAGGGAIRYFLTDAYSSAGVTKNTIYGNGEIITNKCSAESWIHATVVIDGTTVLAYLNGRLTQRNTFTATTHEPDAATDPGIFIGDNYVRGALSDVRIFNGYSMTPADIGLVMKGRRHGAESAWYMPLGTGITGADFSGNGIDLLAQTTLSITGYADPPQTRLKSVSRQRQRTRHGTKIRVAQNGVSGTGTAQAVFGASGTATSTIAGSGSAQAIFSASGVGDAPISGVGSAQAIFSASGVGAAPISGVGSAQAIFSASGAGAAAVAGSGSAQAIFSARGYESEETINLALRSGQQLIV